MTDSSPGGSFPPSLPLWYTSHMLASGGFCHDLILFRYPIPLLSTVLFSSLPSRIHVYKFNMSRSSLLAVPGSLVFALALDPL